MSGVKGILAKLTLQHSLLKKDQGHQPSPGEKVEDEEVNQILRLKLRVEDSS